MKRHSSTQQQQQLRQSADGGWNVPGAVDKQLRNLYYAAGDPGSYGGVDRLYKRARELGIPVTRKHVGTFLTNQLPYSIHKPIRRKFPRNHTYVANVDQQWQADLADMQSIASDNDGFRYILTCIDVLSRYAWAIPVKSKSAKDMITALKQLFRMSRPRKPHRLQTDKGKEFFNAGVAAYLREQGVNHFASNSDNKAAIVERFNRTLKSRIWVHFTANDTTRYVDILGDIVDSYNNTYHRSIRMRPADVDNEQAAHKAWKHLFYKSTSSGGGGGENASEDSLQVNQLVRIGKWKGDFEKGYVPNWSREHFKVARHLQHPRALYNIVDASGEAIDGIYYRTELQPIARNRLVVEKALKQRGRRGSEHHEVLVKWRGWPDKFNRWIAYRDLAKYSAIPRLTDDYAYEDDAIWK